MLLHFLNSLVQTPWLVACLHLALHARCKRSPNCLHFVLVQCRHLGSSPAFISRCTLDVSGRQIVCILCKHNADTLARRLHRIRGLHRQTPEFLNVIYQMPLLLTLAALIADCAACLASGLAGCLALAAAALFQSVLKILCVQALYMFHGFRSSLFIWCTVYHK